MRKTTQPMQADIINISEKVANNLIQKVEDAITEITIKREQIAQELAEKKAAYEAIKSIDDSLVKAIEEEQITLETLVRWKTNTNPTKKIKVYRQLSNTTAHKTSHGGKRIRWVKLITDILYRDKVFHSLDKLFELVYEANPHLPKVDTAKTKTYINYQIGKQIKDIVMYNGKIGLPIWMEGNTIKPQYLNSFV